MKRIKLRYLSVLTALLLGLAMALSFAPARANDVSEGAIYQAGLLRANSTICRCPVMTGDCVCEHKTF
jgi:hypothetical protein